MKPTSYFALSIFILIATACNASPSTSVVKATSDVEEGSGRQRLMIAPELPLEKLRRRIAEFEQGCVGMKEEPQVLEDQEPYVHWEFLPMGWICDLRFDIVKYVISAEDLEIIGVEYRDRKPRDITSKINGWTDTKRLRDIAVKITASQAREAARNYIKSHWKRTILEGLGEDKPELVFNGSYYRYSVNWSLQATEKMVLFGIRQVDVRINPTTGDVYQVDVTEIDPPKTCEISPEECLKIVKSEFADLKNLKVEYIQISTEYTKEMKKRSIWYASIRFTCPEDVVRINPIACNGLGTLIIDGNTGEVLEKSTL